MLTYVPANATKNTWKRSTNNRSKKGKHEIVKKREPTQHPHPRTEQWARWIGDEAQCNHGHDAPKPLRVVTNAFLMRAARTQRTRATCEFWVVNTKPFEHSEAPFERSRLKGMVEFSIIQELLGIVSRGQNIRTNQFRQTKSVGVVVVIGVTKPLVWTILCERYGRVFN